MNIVLPDYFHITSCQWKFAFNQLIITDYRRSSTNSQLTDSGRLLTSLILSLRAAYPGMQSYESKSDKCQTFSETLWAGHKPGTCCKSW